MLRELELKNYKCYESYKTSFTKTTFIKGKNGIGKSTLGVDAYLLLIFGYSKDNLADLPTKGKAKSLTIKGKVEHKADTYDITRQVPTKIQIQKNGVDMEFVSSQEAQNFLNSIFGDVNTFKKFRMIDSGIGINFLEEGQIALKKTLFSTSEGIFNNVRDRLQNIKRDRDILNKDRVVLSKHYPSQKRLDALLGAIEELEIQITPLIQQQRTIQSELRQTSGDINTLKYRQNNTTTEKTKLNQTNKCFTCGQDLQVQNKETLLKTREEELLIISKQIVQKADIIEETQEMLQQAEEALNKIQPKLRRLERLVGVLRTRIQQKQYIYTTKDVEVVKRAIKELDVVSTACLLQDLKQLEPIINSVLEKIKFKVDFQMDDKDKFDIILRKDETDFKYKQLSTGQKLVLQIAFKLALLLQKGETGLIITDEGLSSLDQVNLNHILQIFDSYPFQLIMCLHNFTDVPDFIKTIDLEG